MDAHWIVTGSQQTAVACDFHKTLEVFKPRKKMLEWFNSFRRFSLVGDMEIKSNRSMYAWRCTEDG